MSSSYFCCIITRDGAETIGNTIDSLTHQTVPPEFIVVVNDGSTDNTIGIVNERIKSFPHIHLLNIDSHTRDIRKVPRLLNHGIEFSRKIENKLTNIHYMMVSGDDNELMPNYAEEIMRRMDSDSNLVVASGEWISSRGRTEDQMPHGAGRFVRVSYMEQIGGKYPVAYGWEPWLLYKALELGFKVRIFTDLRYIHLRAYNPKNLFGWGHAMFSLGFPTYFVFFRFVINFVWTSRGTQSRKSAVTMFVGYLSAKIEPQILKGMVIDDRGLKIFIRQFCATKLAKLHF